MRTIYNISLAWRNLFRNARRSIVTLAAIGLSCSSLILIGGYFAMIFAGTELQVVTTEGHVQVYRSGYLEEGAGNPASFAIPNFEDLLEEFSKDPFVRNRVLLTTARLHFQGLVSHYETGTTLPFVGFGVIPEDERRLSRYNPYFKKSAYDLAVNASLFDDTPELSADDPRAVSLGVGLAKSLNLPVPIGPETRLPRKQLSPENGLDAPVGERLTAGSDVPDFDFLDSLAKDSGDVGKRYRPSVELLVVPPGGGVPDLGTFSVRKTQDRANAQIDNILIKLHLAEASGLLFPAEPVRATAIVMLLHEGDDSVAVADYLNEKFKARGEELEAKTWSEIQPNSVRIINMFQVLLVFLACIVTVMVLFMISNTMSAGIIERTSELGTLRAIGLSRSALMGGLVIEGCFLGVGGGLLGVVLALVAAAIVNASTYTYLPPAVSYQVALELMVFNRLDLVTGAFVLTSLSALISSLWPAFRASRMAIIDAIRYV